MEETITITVDEYMSLKKDCKLLSYLRGAGVDNWVGWDEALTMMELDGETTDE